MRRLFTGIALVCTIGGAHCSGEKSLRPRHSAADASPNVEPARQHAVEMPHDAAPSDRGAEETPVTTEEATGPAASGDTQDVASAVRARRLFQLEIGALDSGNATWLVHVVRHGNEYNRRFAADALAKHRPAEAVALFEELGVEQFFESIFYTGPVGIVYLASYADGNGFAFAPMAILSELIVAHYDSVAAEDATPVLLRAVAAGDDSAVMMAARALSGPLILNRIAKQLDNSDVTVRLGAVKALGMIPGANPRIGELLRKARNDADFRVRQAASALLDSSE